MVVGSSYLANRPFTVSLYPGPVNCHDGISLLLRFTAPNHNHGQWSIEIGRLNPSFIAVDYT
jgi:hypothetical protein